ncbi:MAG: hypothetical protein FLDDKLPJ_00155 [Phycisphaerae bacterium]|nr:hypothetical protein [Phycisphaerae bacterium]
MGFLLNRLTVLRAYAEELVRHGCPRHVDADAPVSLFLLDGVGGWQFAPLMIRRVLRQAGVRVHTVLFDWHAGLRGDLLTDLMWRRKNEVAACRLARDIRALQRRSPGRLIHVAAYSGGCGVAVFAAERLREDHPIASMLLLAPAISPTYDLTAALGRVQCCVVGVSRRDRFLLGLGTRLFGTIDRVRTASAGQTGFIPPRPTDPDGADAYRRLQQVYWEPAWSARHHHGGHTGWINPHFLAAQLQDLMPLGSSPASASASA